MSQEKEKKTCQKPEALKGKPEECSAEQIEKCHGKVPEHPCEAESASDSPPATTEKAE